MILFHNFNQIWIILKYIIVNMSAIFNNHTIPLFLIYRKKYCEIREKLAKKESITSIMEEDLEDLNKTFIITEFVLNKHLITYKQAVYYTE